LVLNLRGSVSGAEESLEVVLPALHHAVSLGVAFVLAVWRVGRSGPVLQRRDNPEGEGKTRTETPFDPE